MGHVHEVYAAARKWAEQMLEEWAGAACAQGTNAPVVLRAGVSHEEIVALATDERADLVVVSTHGRGGLSRVFLGSAADRVMRLAPCPVLERSGG